MSAISGKYLSDIPIPPAPEDKGKGFDTLSTKQIFYELTLRTCRVKWELADITLYTTGCFIKTLKSESIQVLTCFHDSSWAHDSVRVSIVYKAFQDNWVALQARGCLAQKINLENAKRFDLCLLDIIEAEAGHGSHFLCFYEKENEPSYFELGETVYFSGFPLLQENPLIHVGHISSKKMQENISEFSIDGTVVEGHSGGPVVMLNNGQLELIGIISSQMVSMTATLLKASKASISQVAAFNDFSGTYGVSDVRTVLKDLVDNFFRNVSTGIGNANPVTSLAALFQPKLSRVQHQDSSELVSSLPTAITTKGSYQTQDSEGNTQDIDFSITIRELRKSGPGPRTVVASIDGVPDSKHQYRIPNPHRGEYNKHQEDAYVAAAAEIAKQYASNKGKMPEQIQFKVKKDELVGTLEKEPSSDKSSTTTTSTANTSKLRPPKRGNKPFFR